MLSITQDVALHEELLSHLLPRMGVVEMLQHC